MNFNENMRKNPCYENPCAAQGLDGLLDDLREGISNIWDYAQTDLGIAVPLDREILALRKGRDKIKSNMLRTTSVIQKMIPSIHNASGGRMSGQRTAEALKQEGGIAYSKGGVTVQYYARAIIAAQTAQAALKTGKPDAKLMGDYFAKKKLAEMEGDATNARFDKFFSNVDEAWKQLVEGDSLTEALVMLPGKIGRDFITKISPYVPSALQATQITKAIPWIIGGVVLLQLMPTITGTLRGMRK